MEKRTMLKIKISWRNKAIYLLAVGLAALHTNEANAAQEAMRRRLAALAQNNPQAAKQFVENRGGIGAELLFPPHWDAFFKHCDPLDYAGTLNAMTAFAQGTLQQPFAQQVKADLGNYGNNIVVAGGNLSVWIEAAQAEALRDKLKIWPEYQKKFNKYKAAAKVHEILNGLDGHACIPTFNFIAASQNCDQSIKEAYTQHLANLNYKNTSITNAVVAKVIDGGQPRADAERDAKIDIERQILTNLGVPQNHVQAVAQDIVVNNTAPVTALTNQLARANAILIGGHDITANVAQKLIQNNINFGHLTQAAAQVNAVLGGANNGACVPVFERIAGSPNCAKSVNDAYKEHVGNVNYKNASITDAIVTKVINGQPRADAERDAKIDVERQILTNHGIPQNHIQAVARDIVVNNTAPDVALTNQLNPILIGGQDITANVAQKVFQNNINFDQLTKAAARVNAALGGANDPACIPVFNIVAVSQNCAKSVNDAFKEHVGNIQYRSKINNGLNNPITEAIVTKVINGKQPYADAERDAKADIERQILLNLGIPQNHIQAIARDIVVNNTAPITALTNQLARANAILIGGQDITANVAQKVIQNNINFVHATQAAARVNAALAGSNDPACVPVFERIAASQNCAKSINEAYKEHVGNIQYKSKINNGPNNPITDAIVTKVINGKQPYADAERDAKADIERQILTNLGVPQIQAQAAAQNIVANTAPVMALTNHLTAVAVDGQDITANVAQRVIQGITLIQATKDAKIFKHTEILKAKAYGFNNETCDLLAIELEKGRTLEQACQEKLDAIPCAGQDIKKLVIHEMINQGKTFDKAYETIAIGTHFANLKQHNIDKGLGLPELVLQHVAEKVGKRQFETYELALVDSSAPIVFPCEGQNIDITKDVLGLVYEGDFPRDSLANATNVVKTDTLKQAYLKKNLELSEQECQSIATNIILHNDAPVDAIAKSLPNLAHRGTSLIKNVALKIAANTRKDTAIHEAKVTVDQGFFFTTLNIGLTAQEAKEVAEKTAKGMGDVKALSQSITPVQCEGTNLTDSVATRMIINRETYDTAAKKLKITHYQDQIRVKSKDLAENIITLAATQFVEGGAPSLEQALANQIPPCAYEGQDLRFAIADRMLQKVSLDKATKAIWIEAATQDIQTNHPKLAGHAQILAQDMFAHKYTKHEALEALLKLHPLFESVQDKIVDVANEILTNNATIKNAWEVVCLNPKIHELKLQYPQFEEGAVIFMATSCVKEGKAELDSLSQYLSSHGLQGKYCQDTNTIANLMIQNKESYKDTLQKAETQIVHGMLTANGGWACLEKGELPKLVNICLAQDTLEEGEGTYIFSVCQNIPGDLLPIFLKQVKYATDKFEKVQNSFLITTVIPARIKEAHPNLTHPKVLEYIAKKLVQTKKVNDPLSPDLLRDALRSASILPNASNGRPYPPNFVEEVAQKLLNDTKLSPDEAITAVQVDHQAGYLQNKYQKNLGDQDWQALAKLFIHHDLEGEVLKQVIEAQFADNKEQIPLEIARKLLENGALSVENALDVIQLDRKAASLKLKYKHLDKMDCYMLAKVVIDHNFQDGQAIAFILNGKKYDLDEIEQMTNAILKNSTFQQAEDTFGYRRFIDEDRGTTEEQAREIAALKRVHGLSDKEAIKRYLKDAFQLASDKEATQAYDFYGESIISMKKAAKMAQYICALDAQLRQKAFFKTELDGDEIWQIACDAYKNGKDEVGALARFLRQVRGIEHPSQDPFISDAYVTCMAKMLLDDNMSMGEASATMMDTEEVGLRAVLNAFFFDPNLDDQLPQFQKAQQWEAIFGPDSLSHLVTIMCYKNDVDFNELVTFESLKPHLQKAIPLFLQQYHPHEVHKHPLQLVQQMDAVMKWPISLFDAVDEQELYQSYYGLIADQMIDGKQNYQNSIQALKTLVDQEKIKFRKLFPYLSDSHIVEISEISVYLKKDQQQQAIYRYLCENKDALSDKMEIFGKKPKNLPDNDWQAYFKDFTQVLSLKIQGELFDATLQGYHAFQKGLERKMVEKVQRVLKLPVQNCFDLVWSVSICKNKSYFDEWMGQILYNNLAQLNIPAIMQGEYFIRAQAYKEICESINDAPEHQHKLQKERDALIEQMTRLKACEKIAHSFTLKGLEDKFPFEDDIEDGSSIIEKGLSNILRGFLDIHHRFYELLPALPNFVLENLSKGLAKAVLGNPQTRQLPLTQQKEFMTAFKYQTVENILLTKKTLFQNIEFFKSVVTNEKPIAEIMINDRVSFGEAVCKHAGLLGDPDPVFNCLGNLILLEIKENHFDLEDFALSPENLIGIAKTLEDLDIFDYEAEEIGCLYRKELNLLPTRVTKAQEKQRAELQKVRQILQQKWTQFYNSMQYTPPYDPYWAKNPYNPIFLKEVLSLTTLFNEKQANRDIKINITNLQYDPWCVGSPYDKIADLTTLEYEVLRNKIFGSITAYLEIAQIYTLEEKKLLLHRIGRFFAWGVTNDMYDKEYLQQYMGWNRQIIREEHLTGEDQKLWRKKVQRVCDNIIFKGNPTNEDIFNNCLSLNDPSISACIIGSRDALEKMEGLIPTTDKPTLFNKIFTCLNNWKKEKLDTLVEKQIPNSPMIVNEYCFFVKLVGKKIFSLHIPEEQMQNHGPLYLNQPGGLNLKLVFDEFLKSYQEDIITIVRNNILCKDNPGNDNSYMIYRSDIEEWANEHPAYCNIGSLVERDYELFEEEEIMDERTGRSTKNRKPKEIVVQRLLKSAGYIDWEDKEKY